eukprot:TRINITY_DN40816_c0_g1_i1.p3 TRINITY_DN40816_c0_g1~~TRINITY_DN40816_c0_g1_i1.p3  ORF type:complete len:186 (-),score=33.99 TRINITY_DN40816_c0_g1_i1:2886-3443(-)
MMPMPSEHTLNLGGRTFSHERLQATAVDRNRSHGPARADGQSAGSQRLPGEISAGMLANILMNVNSSLTQLNQHTAMLAGGQLQVQVVQTPMNQAAAGPPGLPTQGQPVPPQPSPQQASHDHIRKKFSAPIVKIIVAWESEAKKRFEALFKQVAMDDKYRRLQVDQRRLKDFEAEAGKKWQWPAA